MAAIKLTPGQIKTVHACAEDLAGIMAEINAARAAGIPIDPELDGACNDCQERVNGLLNYTKEMMERKVIHRAK